MAENYVEVILFYTKTNPVEWKICKPDYEAEFIIDHMCMGIELVVYSRNAHFLGDAQPERYADEIPEKLKIIKKEKKQPDPNQMSLIEMILGK